MSTLQVLLPPLAHVVADPALRRWLAHGNRLAATVNARDTLLHALFRFAGTPLPVAALRHATGADDARPGAWLAADPAYVRSEATGARLMGYPIKDLDADEAQQLAGVLRPLFGDAGTPLSIDSPSAWCLHLPEGAPLVEFTAPADALGAALLECLPRGEAGRPWRRLFTEAQVLLHAHPVNAARAAAGKQPVNALWFWGAGALPAPVDSTLASVASSAGVVRGLAKLAGVAVLDPVAADLDAAVAGGNVGNVLLDLDTGADVALGPRWLPCFRQWLRARRFAAIELTFADGERWRVRHVHRLRFWRHG